MPITKLRFVALFLVALALLGCTEEANDGVVKGPHALPTDLGADGKFDNYISSNAQEYELKGTAHVVLPDGFATLAPEEQTSKLDGLVSSRLSSVSRAVQSHVEGLITASNGALTAEQAKFFTFFKRNSASAVAPTVLDDGRASFGFEMEFVGSLTLMALIVPDAAKQSFDVVVSDWGSTNNETVSVQLAVSTSEDAFPKYNELFADGVFDIGVHFGGDYNTERYDLETAKWLVGELLTEKWQNPSVKSFEDLKIDSPPFTRTLKVEGREIEARVYVTHSDMVDATEESKLSDAMKTSLRERDIVIYSGHAGPGAGFILDYQPRHEISASEFATVEMAQKYQIYVFDGCQTYRTYVDDLLKNPAKTFDNLDIVTTVNTTPFAVGYQVLWEFLYWFTLTDDGGNHFPMSWTALLRGINTENFADVHYGVHGIDNDPKLNPHASEGVACLACQTDADCKAGGNLCLGYAAGGGCGVACTADSACPDGYRCARLTETDELFDIPKQCVRRDSVCP